MNALRICFVLLVVSLSCQTKPKQETSTTGVVQEDSATMLAKRPGPDTPRSAADRLVRALYFEHNTKENPFQEKKDRALVEQFFIKSTADLIWTDSLKTPGKVNRLKINLLFNAPNKAVKKTWVLPAIVAGSRAVVYVTFENNAKSQEIRLDMQQIKGRWRIIDMLYPDGKQLTQLLQ